MLNATYQIDVNIIRCSSRKGDDIPHSMDTSKILQLGLPPFKTLEQMFDDCITSFQNKGFLWGYLSIVNKLINSFEKILSSEQIIPCKKKTLFLIRLYFLIYVWTGTLSIMSNHRKVQNIEAIYIFSHVIFVQVHAC